MRVIVSVNLSVFKVRKVGLEQHVTDAVVCRRTSNYVLLVHRIISMLSNIQLCAIAISTSYNWQHVTNAVVCHRTSDNVLLVHCIISMSSNVQ